MSQLVEACPACDWSSQLTFRYHGGVPVEHPICPSCGGEITWTYHFAPREIEASEQEMAEYVVTDEAGFPVDRSPTIVRLDELLDDCLRHETGVDLRLTNHRGVVDVELRAYADHDKKRFGAKAVANVGQAQFAIGLVDLLTTVNRALPLGELVAHPSSYGTPLGAIDLVPFGEGVNLLYQAFLPERSFEDGTWTEDWLTICETAAQLAQDFATTNHMRGLAQTTTAEPPPEQSDDDGVDEFTPRAPVELENVASIIAPLMSLSPDAEEISDRIDRFLAEMELPRAVDPHGQWVFKLDSARIAVGLIHRNDRLLVRLHSTVLDHIDLDELTTDDPQVPARLLTTLNHQSTVGRCVLEESDHERPEARILLEKTLLALDLDLSEFFLTLAAFAEQADQMDNILQEGLGGLRADQLEVMRDGGEQQPDPTDLAPLVRRIATRGLPEFTRVGADVARKRVRHMLEEVNLVAEEDAQGTFWFDYGSARFSATSWHDELATYLTLRATVLSEVERTAGLPEALNQLNRHIHFGAFALNQRDGDVHTVELAETILADDLAVEELAYALLTIGQLADDHDDPLKARFGGVMGQERLQP